MNINKIEYLLNNRRKNIIKKARKQGTKQGEKNECSNTKTMKKIQTNKLMEINLNISIIIIVNVVKNTHYQNWIKNNPIIPYLQDPI